MKNSSNPRQYDVIVIGAGFAGIYQIYALKKAGMTALVLEAGSAPGGTWFWNRYPGARCDVESLDYSYSFDKDLQQEWSWSERYSPQPEILRYINRVIDKHGLRADIQLNSRVASSVYTEDSNTWTTTTTQGEDFVSKYVIYATGLLSTPQAPKLAGLEDFKGDWYHSAYWPSQGVDFTGKRVGLIGTGSSGVQMTPEIAAQAAHLTVFQRTANFSVPAQNEPITEAQQEKIKADYPERRRLTRMSSGGHLIFTNDKSALEVSEEERLKEYESRWKGAGGGFRMLRSFNDLMTNIEANKTAADFVREKIRKTVKNPAVAEMLCPKSDLPFGTKRLCVDSGYYETFNRSNVSLVDIKEDPIVAANGQGLVQSSGRTYDLDAIVFATGFDAVTGALNAIDVRGRDGCSLREKWKDGPRSYLGLTVAGFPNMFVITGPGSPSALVNVVHAIELHVEWITDCLKSNREKNVSQIDTSVVAEDAWVQHVDDLANKTLYPQANSWYTGANIEGKPRVFMMYVAGVSAYREILDRVAENDYEGFVRA